MRSVQRRYMNILRQVKGNGVANRYEREAKRLNDYDVYAEGSPIRYSPDTKLDAIVLDVRSKENDLMCRHGKFMFHVCSSCHRDKRQADAYKSHCAKRVQSILT